MLGSLLIFVITLSWGSQYSFTKWSILLVIWVDGEESPERGEVQSNPKLGISVPENRSYKVSNSGAIAIQIDLIDLIMKIKQGKETQVVYTNKKQQSVPKDPARMPTGDIASTKDFVLYSLALAPSRSSAPAPVMAGLSVSTTVVWKRTVLPSFHISVLRV